MKKIEHSSPLQAGRLILGLGLATASAQVLALAILLGDPQSGQALHEQRCAGCHVKMYGGDGSEIYTRDNRSVKSVEGLQLRMELCNTNTQNGELNADQLDDLTAYLNESYYRFDD